MTELTWATAAATRCGELWREATAALGADAALVLDREVITSLICPGCGRLDDRVRPAAWTGPADLACPACGREFSVISTHLINGESALLGITLADIGIPAGDIVRREVRGLPVS